MVGYNEWYCMKCSDYNSRLNVPCFCQSAMGFEYKGEVDQHTSQKGTGHGNTNHGSIVIAPLVTLNICHLLQPLRLRQRIWREVWSGEG